MKQTLHPAGWHRAMTVSSQLQALVRQHKTPQQLATWARIILQAHADRGVSETAAAVQVSRSLVQRWRRRWRERADQPLEQRLKDEPRPGTPATFSPEQVCALIFDRLSDRGFQKHVYNATNRLGENLSSRPYSYHVYWMGRSFAAHEALNQIALRRGQKIVNLTAGGFRDAYDKARFEDTL